MVSNMKTTIEIADPLLEEARKLARREGTTLRCVVERALRREVQETSVNSSFRLRDLRVHGGGLNSEYNTWAKVREALYERESS